VSVSHGAIDCHVIRSAYKHERGVDEENEVVVDADTGGILAREAIVARKFVHAEEAMDLNLRRTATMEAEVLQTVSRT
jgi:hypothetical protein